MPDEQGQKSKRRMKGEGSVYQRKSDNRWVGSFKIEETGKLKYVYAKTKREVLNKLKKAQREQEQGVLTAGPNQKTGDYLNWWLEEVHKQKLRVSTYRLYSSVLRNHILPGLGHIQLRKLTAQHIQTFYNKKLSEKLSSSSLYNMQKIIHGALDAAVKYRYIPFNPADAIELPSKEPQRPGQSLTLEQSQLLLKAAQGHRLEAFIALALTTAMRHGELEALRWEDIDDIDPEMESIFVHRTVSRLGGCNFVEGSPKTKKSVRTVPLIPDVRRLLEAHRKKQDEVKREAGNQWQEKGLVFCNRYGGFWQPDYTREAFYKLLEQAGLPRIVIHDLRHTASTLWAASGVSDKMRQEWLGHTRLEMTNNVYTHVFLSMHKDAAEKIRKMFQGHDTEQ